ncbi:hypothetical protein EDB84DRAFT_1581506 [Lactarius hengduanensis]|nr:hypothetical protein EDB84DRAFT_1581506 [Lactarius hengduanensis]
MARCVSSLLTTPVLGSPFVSGCDGSLRFEPADDAATPVLGSPVQCERLPTLLHCVPADDVCPWLSTYHTHHCPTSPCVHALLSSPLMVSIFDSPVYSAGYVTAYHSKRAICITVVCFYDLRSLSFQLTSSGLSGHHLILAVILIFKHATFLRLSNMTSKSALIRAELDYRDANIDSSIQKYLTASSQEHSVELFAAFIIATDIVPSESSVKNRVYKDH